MLQGKSNKNPLQNNYFLHAWVKQIYSGIHVQTALQKMHGTIVPTNDAK